MAIFYVIQTFIKDIEDIHEFLKSILDNWIQRHIHISTDILILDYGDRLRSNFRILQLNYKILSLHLRLQFTNSQTMIKGPSLPRDEYEVARDQIKIIHMMKTWGTAQIPAAN